MDPAHALGDHNYYINQVDVRRCLPGMCCSRSLGSWRRKPRWWCVRHRGLLSLIGRGLPCAGSDWWGATSTSHLRLRKLCRWWWCSKRFWLGIEFLIDLSRVDYFSHHNRLGVITSPLVRSKDKLFQFDKREQTIKLTVTWKLVIQWWTFKWLIASLAKVKEY